MRDRIERRIWLAASVGEVWDVITADGWLADEVRFDLRPGGDAEFRSGDEVKEGWVEESTAPRDESAPARLTFWWEADGEPATRVDLALEPVRDGTQLRVVETRPLDVLDLVGVPLHRTGGRSYGPALVAA